MPGDHLSREQRRDDLQRSLEAAERLLGRSRHALRNSEALLERSCDRNTDLRERMARNGRVRPDATKVLETL